MSVTFNQQIIKKENKMLVLQKIRSSGQISRAAIAQQTGLNKGTVSSLVSELLTEQLVIEIGQGTSSGGRRPVLLQFNEKAGYSIGIDIGVNDIYSLLTDLSGNIIYKNRKMTKHLSLEQFEHVLIAEIKSVINLTPTSPYGIVGIGIAIPGLIDEHHSILIAPNLGWKNYDLKTKLMEIFDIPVVIENEANAGAFGEMTFGSAQGIDHLVYVSAGIGIGTGAIINGELYKGDSGFSGEFGHMTVQMDGITCSCGNKGCWELYASEQFLERHAPESFKINDDYLIDLLEGANNGNQACINLLEQTARNLSVGIVNIIHALNPQMIIIGNRLSALKQALESSVQTYVNQHILTSHQNINIVQFSENHFPASALGMTAFTLNRFIQQHFELETFV